MTIIQVLNISLQVDNLIYIDTESFYILRAHTSRCFIFSKLWGNRKDTNQKGSPLACPARAGDLETEGTCAGPQEPRLGNGAWSGWMLENLRLLKLRSPSKQTLMEKTMILSTE